MGNLAVQDLTKSYGSVHVLKHINLAIDEGDFLVLVGPSGCGKSTLLSIIAGLEQQTSGSILISGKVVDTLEPKERDIAMVFQSYALYPAMTVADNIGFALEMSGVPKPERLVRIQKVAELLQIEHLLQRKPGQLSGGQRQRVAMGRALVREPKLFLFDEPLSNLDAKLRVEMRTEIKKLHTRLQTTIVYVTHDQIEAMTMATRIAVMKDGLIQQFGTPSDIYDRPANTFVATFMGSPPMNLVPVTVEDGQLIMASGERLSIPVGVNAAAITGGKLLLGLRPEWIALADQGAKDSFRMEIEVVEPTGPDLYVNLNFGGQAIIARLPAGESVKQGEYAQFLIDSSKTMLFDADTGMAL
ncbi:multiple sugar transport system ATP-binding protein [Thiothrix eikelboomii]|uniref:Multiple sugar transport system ATP-binding protein n=1 Tax=Thiothrix eikelboomii TaxID=92487 RepID=A0A1T4WZT1_9GAMM|nr:sn-glycerol-3-phosphate ABC transporter ATP-binding protein UgpC [Thiothrix eikelboomii]SKA82862.1 multiple sugar transport system ATP-binding protein [Thiothrix eikelboomii]